MIYGKMIRTVFAGAFLIAFSTSSQAIIMMPGDDPYAFTWSYETGDSVGTLEGAGTLEISAWSTTQLTIDVWLYNDSYNDSSARLTAFGFGIDPDAASVTFSDDSDGGMVSASLDNIPSLALIDVCTWGGNNCNGGSNGGLSPGDSDSFQLLLAGNWNLETGVDIDPIGFKYQTEPNSYEFTTTSVPEPSTLLLMATSLAGLGFASQRKKQA
jgi:hypothetical protein